MGWAWWAPRTFDKRESGPLDDTPLVFFVADVDGLTPEIRPQSSSWQRIDAKPGVRVFREPHALWSLLLVLLPWVIGSGVWWLLRAA
jgi:hypothetical protein